MTTLLDLWIPGIPPGKNRRTRMNTKTGRLYTEPSVRAWMAETALQVRLARKGVWKKGMDVQVWVVMHCADKGAWKWDLDGALPCLVDAVMAGLMPEDRKRPPDEYVTHIDAWKIRAGNDGALVQVEVVEEGKEEGHQ